MRKNATSAKRNIKYDPYISKPIPKKEKLVVITRTKNMVGTNV
tara:strand:- start:84 stop:212 length:129 start_codon:yes stop_codon:yes gene_type:complete